MTVVLRVILIVLSVLVFILMMRKIRQAKLQIEDSIFWIFFSLLLILFSLFPRIADWLSDRVGTMSTSNFIFLLMIFLLLIKNFSMSVHISQLEAKIKELAQKIALDNNKDEQERRKQAFMEEKQAGRNTE